MQVKNNLTCTNKKLICSIDNEKQYNINDAYAETIQEVGGLQPWFVVLATFLVLVVGLGAGTGW
jgi:uncharacterized membrane protein